MSAKCQHPVELVSELGGQTGDAPSGEQKDEEHFEAHLLPSPGLTADNEIPQPDPIRCEDAQPHRSEKKLDGKTEPKHDQSPGHSDPHPPTTPLPIAEHGVIGNMHSTINCRFFTFFWLH